MLWLSSWIPLSALHWLGDQIGKLVYCLPTESRRVTLINLARVFPELDEAQRRALARQSLSETVKTGLELGHLWYGSLDSLIKRKVSIEGMEYIKAAQDAGKGIIYVAPHLGSWEWLGIYTSTLAPMSILYKPSKIKGLNSLIAGARAKAGAELVTTDRQGVVSLVRALERKEAIGVLPDQQPREGGVFAPFFGIQAYTMTLLPKLASRTGAAVVFGYARRLPYGKGYEAVFRPAEPGVDDADPVVAATAMNRSVERCVRELPAQYQWEYKRFRKRPEGEAPFYQEP